MAKETITVKVAPEDEQSTINIYSAFGWEVLSSQQIYNKDTHLETKDDKLYSVTETTNFVRIVLCRDSNIPNYSKLCELQNRYENIYTPEPNLYKGKKFLALFSFILDFIIYLIGASFADGNTLILTIVIASVIILALINISNLIYYIIKGSKNKNEYYKNKRLADEERAKIIEEALELSY